MSRPDPMEYVPFFGKYLAPVPEDDVSRSGGPPRWDPGHHSRGGSPPRHGVRRRSPFLSSSRRQCGPVSANPWDRVPGLRSRLPLPRHSTSIADIFRALLSEPALSRAAAPARTAAARRPRGAAARQYPDDRPGAGSLPGRGPNLFGHADPHVPARRVVRHLHVVPALLPPRLPGYCKWLLPWRKPAPTTGGLQGEPHRVSH